jgi:4-amino-4-deoxy-L-arabinose transferase-like glycosyltransferase/sugar lactone lactonase YvrE
MMWWHGAKGARVRLGTIAVGALLAFLGQKTLEAGGGLGAGLACYAAALTLWIVALAGSPWLTGDRTVPPRSLPRYLETAALVGILLVGLFLRVYRLSDIPIGLSIDGSANALKALDILRGAPYEPLHLSRETMYHYIMAGFFRALGPSLLSVRLTSAFLGMAGLATFYVLARELFEARMALLATLIFATAVYHITYSRTGWRAIQVPIFEFAAFFCVLRAQRTVPRQGWRAVGWWAAGGVAVGLGLNTYESFRLVVLALAGYLLGRVVRRPALTLSKDGFLARYWRGLAAFVVCAALFFGPLGWEAITHWAEFNARSQAVFIGERMRQAQSWQPLWDNIRNALLTYNYRALGDFFDNAKPLLDRPWAILYVGGLALLFGNLHCWRSRLLLFWLVVALLPGVLSWPNAQRLMAATPFAFLFGGLFLYAVWRTVEDAQWAPAAYPLFVGLGALLFVCSYMVYLGPQRRLVWGYEPERVAVAEYLKPIGPTDEVLVEERFNQGQVDFINYVPSSNPFEHRFVTFDRQRDVPLRRAMGRPVTIVLEDRAENRALEALLRSFYPDCWSEQITDGYNRTVAFAVRIPQQSIDASWGMRAVYFADAAWQEPLFERVEANLPASPLQKVRSAEWQAFLWVDRLDEYDFQVNDDPVWLTIDGQPVIEDATAGTVLLSYGLHPLTLRAEGHEGLARLAISWRTGDQSYTLLPRERLFTLLLPDSTLLGRPTRRELLAWEEVWTVGSNGSEPGQFYRPMNVALYGDDWLYVGDADNRRVQRLRSEDGSYSAQWGKLGVAPGDLEHDLALAIGADGTLYVSDRWNDRLQAWSAQGEFLGVVVPPGEVSSPRGVVVLPDGDVLVASAGHGQVRRFGADGVLKASWGEWGTAPGQLMEPVGLAYDARRNLVYVSDAGKSTVQKYNLDGQFLLEWPVPGVMWESFVAVDPDGRVFVSAPDHDAVYAFAPDGTMLVWGARATQFDAFSQMLRHPVGLTFDARGDLYLTNTWADQVKRFRRVPVAQQAPAVESALAPPADQPYAFEPLYVYRGTTESRPVETAVGSITVTGDTFTVLVGALPGQHAVFDYLRFVDQTGREYRFEAEDAMFTSGDTFSLLSGEDGHWWLQEFEPFSGGRGLVADESRGAPLLTCTVRLPDGEYLMSLGTFTGDPASGPFAITLDY